jgi:hypothetical protein
MNGTVLARYALPAILLLTPVSVEAQTRDHAPAALPSGSKMTQEKPGSESWTYAQPAARFVKYRTVIVDPTTVYSGPDAQFEGVDAADRQKFADIITQELQSEMAKSFPVPAKVQADTLRLRVQILGAKKTIGGVATATRVTPIGFATSALKSALGKKGTLTGSVLYSVEAYDAQTNELLIAAVRRRTPDPLDVPATLSTTDTVKSVARDFANSARKRLEALTQVKGAE